MHLRPLHRAAMLLSLARSSFAFVGHSIGMGNVVSHVRPVTRCGCSGYSSSSSSSSSGTRSRNSNSSSSSSSDGNLRRREPHKYRATSTEHGAPIAAAGQQDKEVKPIPREGRMLRPSPKFVAVPFSYLEEITLTITDLTNLGEGVARTDDGWVVMVAHTIPGEVVRAKVFRNHDNYSEATLSEVLEPSPNRVEPPCPLFGLCGGCQYQHIGIETQRERKRQQVITGLQRLGGVADPVVSNTVGSPELYNYRSKLTPHYDKPDKAVIKAIGFNRVKFPTLLHHPDLSAMSLHRVIDVEQCPIATKAINERLPETREKAREGVRQLHEQNKDARDRRRARGATLLLRDVEEGVVSVESADVTTEVAGLKLRFAAGDFFQNNPYVAPLMVEHVVQQATKGGKAKHLIDTYCGGGMFCLSASSSFESCAGIEISGRAIRYANENAKLNGIDNCHFIAGTSEGIFKEVKFDPLETVVVIDPPRKGCDESFLSQLFKFRPIRLVYMSCDPSTQARDTAPILAAGYTISDVTPFDLFPQTRHIENCITFELEEGEGE